MQRDGQLRLEETSVTNTSPHPLGAGLGTRRDVNARQWPTHWVKVELISSSQRPRWKTILLKVVLFYQQNYSKYGLNLILKSFILGLISSGSEDVWLGAKFPKDQLQIKTSSGNSETWGDYNGWSSWRNDITPARGISSERRLLMKGDSSGDWVVWNGNEKKGFVCQYKKNGKLDILFQFPAVNTLI